MRRSRFTPALIWVAVLQCFGAGMYAQTQSQFPGARAPSAPSLKVPAPISLSHPLLPAYIRSNPMGYAPLCRLEVKIEQKLPIGVWLRADGMVYNRIVNPGLAYLRFKLPLTSR